MLPFDLPGFSERSDTRGRRARARKRLWSSGGAGIGTDTKKVVGGDKLSSPSLVPTEVRVGQSLRYEQTTSETAEFARDGLSKLVQGGTENCFGFQTREHEKHTEKVEVIIEVQAKRNGHKERGGRRSLAAAGPGAVQTKLLVDPFLLEADLEASLLSFAICFLNEWHEVQAVERCFLH